MQNGEKEHLEQGAKWVWENRDWVVRRARDIWRWLFPEKQDEAASSILIIGPGGVGKSTLARMLAGDYSSFLDIPGPYEESIRVEELPLKDDEKVALVVPPGQRHRRDATWAGLQATISTGGYRGIILVSSFGYHSMGEMFTYRQHDPYKGDKAALLNDFLAESRADEVKVLERLVPYMQINRRRSWILTVVTKQDLWWRESAAAEAFYRTGEYGKLMDGVIQNVGTCNLRHECVPLSLVISNFVTGRGELLAETVAGYDQGLQAKSVRRLWETLDALKNWEENP